MNKFAIQTWVPDLRARARAIGFRVTSGALMALPMLAHADPVADIDAAKTTALAIAGALVTLVVAVWAALYVKKFFGGK